MIYYYHLCVHARLNNKLNMLKLKNMAKRPEITCKWTVNFIKQCRQLHTIHTYLQKYLRTYNDVIEVCMYSM